ncbi:PorP/SprF family type IX secretion system membrane protein [Bizionia sediminis]|uniref:PorP/SprF family type IX secretion system membrane protein n=1 Tax=Bizionia sediminis TaxID=1737064 RepID=A0ABW5KPL5_9FLAO
MVKGYILLIVCLLAAFTFIKAQEMPVLTFSVPAQNNIKFNRFIQNPTYSFVGEDRAYISMYHRNQWIEFNDSPKAYMLSYTGRFNDKTGLGIGVYQQSTGVINSFGAIGNYAHSIRLTNTMRLAFGFNLAYYSSGIANNRTVTAQDDPLLLSFRSTSLVTIKPGINLSFKQFDLGFYAENLVDYDFKTSKMASQYINKTYSAQLQYTHDFFGATGLFEATNMRLALVAEMNESFGTGFGGSVLTNFPKMGWLQLGIDNYYGVGAGIGAHLSKRLSIGYIYERTTKEGLVNLGPTHEVNLVFAIGNSGTASNRKYVAQSKKKPLNPATNDVENPIETMVFESAYPETETQTTTTTTTTETTTTRTTTTTSSNGLEKVQNQYRTNYNNGINNNLNSLKQAQANRIAELQKQLDAENAYLLDILLQEQALNTLKAAELEDRIKNLQAYAQRQKQAQTIPSTDIKTIVLKSANPPVKKIQPQSVDDLKNAENGFYLVSEAPSQNGQQPLVSISRFERLADAVSAYNIAYAKNPENTLYIVHVNNPDSHSTGIYNNTQPATTSNTNPYNTPPNNNETITFSGLAALTPNATKASGSNSNRNDDSISKEKVLGNRLITSLPISRPENKAIGSTPKTDSLGATSTIAGSNQNANQASQIAANSSNNPTEDSMATTTPKTSPSETTNIDKTTIADNKNITPKTKNNESKTTYATTKKPVKQFDDDYDTETRRKNVNLSLIGVEPGYYIVANVFSQFSNAENFLNALKAQGLDPAYFKNPRNKYTYVYLKRFDEWRSASKAFHSKLNNTYTGKIWIMSINID